MSHRIFRYWSVYLICLFVSATAAFAQSTGSSAKADKEYEVAAVLWQQSSGEQRALCYQTFALARILLDRDLGIRNLRRPRAIILDIDETILDNSRYEAALIKEQKNYPEGWTAWINRAEAAALPGAVEFLRYANSRGVRVFYVTNRKDIEKQGTYQNLKALNFPDVSDQTLIIRTDPKSDSKETRRRAIASKYHVVFLMGDDLNDFAEVFEKSRTVETRIEAAERNRSLFGTKFLMLPNAMYGDWENAIYEYNFKLTEEQKAAKRRALLKE